MTSVESRLLSQFPALSLPQATAMLAGLPVPPSPNWDGGEAGAPQGKMISCLCVIARPDQRPAAAAAAAEFADQGWQRRELVLINQSGSPLFVRCPAGVREILTGGGLIAGMNAAMAAAKGGWQIGWEVDDIHHPQLLELLAAFRQPGRAVALASQLQKDGEVLREAEGATGLSSVCLMPAGGPAYRTDAGSDYESRLFDDHLLGRCVVIPTAGTLSAVSRIRCYSPDDQRHKPTEFSEATPAQVEAAGVLLSRRKARLASLFAAKE